MQAVIAVFLDVNLKVDVIFVINYRANVPLRETKPNNFYIEVLLINDEIMKNFNTGSFPIMDAVDLGFGPNPEVS